LDTKAQHFYDNIYYEKGQRPTAPAQAHPFYPVLSHFVSSYALHDKHCLEIGCGRGVFQDVVNHYTGVDLSHSVGADLHKPFFVCSATALPFAANAFDAVWSYAVLEHVPHPELALREMRRVLKPNGLLLLAPAWQCRPWAAQGYPVRPYSDFKLAGKLIKASIPLRDSVLFRAISVFPRRMQRLLIALCRRQPTHFSYRLLEPNYDHFWMSDADAVNSMDPFEAILWFASRGDSCLSPPTRLRQFFVRSGALVLQIHKNAEDDA
jgi:SAM-dependent methyltransferase